MKRGFYPMIEPSGVADEDLWQKAKNKADKYKDDVDYWGVVSTIYRKSGGKFQKREATTDQADIDYDAEVRQLILDNPDISASTLLNVLKSKGFVIVKKSTDYSAPKADGEEQSEADSGGSNAQFGRAGVNPLQFDSKVMGPLLKKNKKKESIKGLRVRSLQMREKSYRDDGIGPKKFDTVMIEEGMGNLADAFYYTRSALESAVPIFEGKKIYANHPKKSEDMDRPERDVRDILGYFENVRIEETEDGRPYLNADVHVMDEKGYEWARGLMRYAIKYREKFPDKEFVGLSINASGEAHEVPIAEFLEQEDIPESARLKIHQAMEEGIESIRVVTEITDAVSCDLVTEAGAGGKILQILEQEKQGDSSMKTKKVKNREAEMDAGDDQKLIQQLMDKHMAEGDSEEQCEGMAREAYEMAREMGYEGDEAMKMADYGMKMMKKKMETKAEGSDEEEEKPEEAVEAADGEGEEEKQEEAVESKESNKEKEENMKLKGQIASLESRLRNRELADYLDEKLAESGLPSRVTKLFRESIETKTKTGKVIEAKSEAEIDSKLKLFKEGYDFGGKAETDVIFTEKGSHAVGGRGQGKLDLSDCLN